MKNIYEAVMIDEELGIVNEGSVKGGGAEATTIAEPSTKEIASTTTFEPPIHCNLIIFGWVQFGYAIASILLIEINVSCSVKDV